MSRDLLDLVRELNTLNDDNLADRVIENSDVQWCLSELQDILEEMPTLTPQNEWVSVEERLPEDDAPKHKVEITVLVLTDREDVKIKNRTYHPARFYYGKFYPERWDWGTFNDDRITHWMPRPTPPGKDNNVPTKEPNEPLTIEQLREMDGEPVWADFTGSVVKREPGWFILRNAQDEEVYLVGKTSVYKGYEYYGKTWIAYRRPPERQEDTNA